MARGAQTSGPPADDPGHRSPNLGAGDPHVEFTTLRLLAALIGLRDRESAPSARQLSFGGPRRRGALVQRRLRHDAGVEALAALEIGLRLRIGCRELGDGILSLGDGGIGAGQRGVALGLQCIELAPVEARQDLPFRDVVAVFGQGRR